MISQLTCEFVMHTFLSIETAAMQKEIVEEYQMQRSRSGEDVRGNTEEQK